MSVQDVIDKAVEEGSYEKIEGGFVSVKVGD